MTAPGAHLDLLRLDALRVAPGDADALETAHLAACPSCRATLAELEALAHAVRARAPAPVEIPAAVDRAVRAAYRETLERRARRPLVRWLVPAGALAAAAAIVLVARAPSRPAGPAPAPQAIAAGPRAGGADDLDGDGTIDIVDAYLLSLREGEGSAEGGGRVAAVDALARKAVALP